MPPEFRRWTVALVAEWKARVALRAAMEAAADQRNREDPATKPVQLDAGQSNSARSGRQQEDQAS